VGGLSQDELERKRATVASGVYQMLFAQLGTIILEAMPRHAAREQFLKGRRALPSPAPEQMLRYEVRGRALEESAAVPEAITFQAHYAPLFEALCGRA